MSERFGPEGDRRRVRGCYQSHPFLRRSALSAGRRRRAFGGRTGPRRNSARYSRTCGRKRRARAPVSRACPRHLLHLAGGHVINEQLYMAVATVLAFAFRVENKMAREKERTHIVVPVDMRFDADGGKITRKS